MNNSCNCTTKIPQFLSLNESNSSAVTFAGRTDLSDARSLASNIVIAILLIVIAVVAFVGNVLVILSVFLYPRLREEACNLFIVNLSITDLSSSSVVMLTSVIAVCVDGWPLGHVFCSIVCGANYCFIIVSMLTLCFISLDRHVAINHSLRYHSYITRTRILLLCAYTWFQGFVFGLAPIVRDWVDYDYWEMTCAIQWHIYGVPVLTYVIIAFIVCFTIPGIILAGAYCKVFKTATKIKPRAQPMVNLEVISNGRSAVNLHNSTSLPRTSSAAKQKVKYSESSKAVRSLLIVVVAYFVCMTPFSVTKLYKVIVPTPMPIPGYANVIATFFQYMASAVNPLIYGLFRRDFQKAFMYLMWRTVRNNESGRSSGINSSTF